MKLGFADDFVKPLFERVPSQLQIEELNGNLPGAAGGGLTPKPIIQLALDLIKAYEGWSSNAYDDPANYCTIGYGHLIKKDRCANIDLKKVNFSELLTEKEGNTLLAADTKAARLIIQRLVKVDLTKQQFGALTSFVFNIGGANFSGSRALAFLNENDFDHATTEMRKWVHAKGKKLAGLVSRRNCEVVLFKTGTLSRTTAGEVDIQACGSAAAGAPEITEMIDIETGQAVTP
ncbi:MAG: hypothetical protein EOR60_15025 [Mesorhizobium sp.]|nr:MAG: hypothetical protein EOR60_15025 [Mesorhizobium sp.]